MKEEFYVLGSIFVPSKKYGKIVKFIDKVRE